MKILHLLGLHKLPRQPEVGSASGVVRVALEIAARQVVRGNEVTIAVADSQTWKSEWRGVRLIGLRNAPRAKIRSKRGMLDFSMHLPYMYYSMAHAVDIIHAHNYSYLRFLKAGARILHWHSDPYYKGRKDHENLDLKPGDFLSISRYSQAQIAVSQFIASQLALGLGEEGNIYPISNGVDLERFSREARDKRNSSWRKPLGISAKGKVILYAGAITREKGVEHLARVFLHIAAAVPDIHLLLAGSSNLWGNASLRADPQEQYERSIMGLLSESIRSGRVHFLGKIDIKEMPDVYAACEMVVIPSICREAFGLVALEALASGRPVVASRTGGLPEIINESNGILVEPGNEPELERAIMKLIADRNLRNRMGEAGRNTAMQFSWDKTVEQIERVYRSLLRIKKL